MEENTKNDFVIDSSFILASLLPDEKNLHVSEIVRNFIEGEIIFISAEIFPFEVANGLKSAVLRKRIKIEKAQLLLKNFLDFDITLENIDMYHVYLLAEQEHISVYDASYVWLARSKNLSLLTLDNRLAKIIK